MSNTIQQKALNTNQLQAIKITDNPLIITAGPGTGKTMLITFKIDYLIKEKKIKENEILAITFTNKASNEISRRTEQITKKEFKAKTFHQFALELIEKYQRNIPLIDKKYTQIDESAQYLFFIENLDKFNLSSIEIKNNTSLLATELTNTISKLKDFGYSLNKFEKMPIKDMTTKIDILTAYSKYELYKKKNNYIDFGDMLLYIKELLKTNKEIRKEIQKKYKYILVDEFQDTNKVQLDIIKLITNKEDSNITIVGDKKQSIYQFRGGNSTNLNNFKKHFKNYKEIYLKENYRSSKEVIKYINKITKEISSKDEILNGNSKLKGEVKLIEATNENSQNYYLAQNISKITQKNDKATIGILFRTKSELLNTSTYFKELGIEHTKTQSDNIFSTLIIRSVLEELKITKNPREANNEIFKLLLDYGFRNETTRKLLRQAKIKEKSIFEIITNYDITDYEDEKSLLKKIYNKINSAHQLYKSKIGLYNLIRKITFKFNNYKQAIISQNQENINTLNQFLNFTKKYSQTYKNLELEQFLKTCKYLEKSGIDLFKENNQTNSNIENQTTITTPQIELLTIHSSKGKEFDHIFIPSLNKRRFPSNFHRSKFEIFEESKDKFIEEENRLFFVALSRAKQNIHLSYIKQFTNNKALASKSELLNQLNLTHVTFNKEFQNNNNQLNTKDNIKIEIITKIKKLLLENEFELAQKEIILLRSLFNTKKDLSDFMNKKNDHENYNFYKEKLNNRIEKNNKEIEENVDISSKKFVYSVSQLKTYKSCPKKYLYQYIYKIPSKVKHYFDFGTSLHTVFEELVFDFNKGYSKETLFARGMAKLSSVWISKGYENSTQEKEYYKKGIKAVKDFIETQTKMLENDTKLKTIDIEKRFLIEINGKKIMGFIDRIDKTKDGLEILDYKTSNSKETKKQLQENLQLFVYSIAAKEVYSELPNKVGLWYVIFNELVKIDIKDIDFEKSKKKMFKLIEGIENSDFTAKPSYFACNFCDFNNICQKSKTNQ